MPAPPTVPPSVSRTQLPTTDENFRVVTGVWTRSTYIRLEAMGRCELAASVETGRPFPASFEPARPRDFAEAYRWAVLRSEEMEVEMEDGTRVTVSLRDTMAFALTDPIAKVRASGTRSDQSRIGEVLRTCAGFRSAHPSKSRDTSAACVTEIGAVAARREPFPHGCADCQDLSVLVEYVTVLLANGKSRAQVPPEPNSSYRARPHKHAVRSHDASAHREGCSRTMQPCIALLSERGR